ncbi:MAG: carboxypeptidase-like regulatory domain-containing protein, partial [Longimicrobiales bacterium]
MPGHPVRTGGGVQRLVAALGVGFVLAVLSAPVAGQTGTVTGTVVDQATRQPLNGVQVSVEGTNRGGLTDGRGQFTIPGVPAGQHTVEVVFIGYRTEQ